MLPGAATCYAHPDRAGLGVCVECRQVICRECTTQFEGINRCARCLQQRLAKGRELPARKEGSAGTLALAALSAAFVFAVIWVLARVLSA